jgi:L-alanine-DL-glutamate epimerase-like enolase superfamily enzyme
MKITDIRFIQTNLVLDPPFCPNWDPKPRTNFSATLTMVETDAGVVGFGSGDTMEGFAGYEKHLLGTDLFDIENHVRRLETISFHGGRYWPIEAALWDAIGKAKGKSVAELFGGKEKFIPAYASTGAVMTPEERAKSAELIKKLGFKALKIRVPQSNLDLGIKTLKAIRESVGDDLQIMVDLNQAWRMPGDTRDPLDFKTVSNFLDACVDYKVFWLEEPLPMEDIDGLRKLQGRGVKIAGGEMVRTIHEVRRLLDADALDVYQMDVVLSVGLHHTIEIADKAKALGKIFTPHTWSNGYGLMANLQVTAGIGGAPFIEFPFDPPTWSTDRRDFLLAKTIEVDENGNLWVPNELGMGCNPNSALLQTV